MDPKEIKKKLKDAKEAIKNKDSRTAVRLCKGILKEDRNNYVALVLFGAALQETDQRDQAPNAYKKAAEASPDQPLAWQGLISFYEKVDSTVSDEELLKAYKHLVLIETDPIKRQELAEKLGGKAVKLKNAQVCADVLSSLSNGTVAGYEIRKAMVKALTQIKDLSKEQSVMVEESLELMLNEWKNSKKPGDQDIHDSYRRYLKLLYRNGRRKAVLEEANIMSQRFLMDPYPLEWLCKVWVEFVAEDKDVSFIKDCIPNHLKNLFALNKSSSAVMMARGALHYVNRELVQAREELSQAITTNQAPWHVHFLSAKNELQLYCPAEAERCLNEASALASKAGVGDVHLRMIQQFTAEALSLQANENKTQQCIKLCDMLLNSNKFDKAVNLIKARALVALGQFGEAQGHLTEAGPSTQTTILLARILIKKGELDQASHFLESQAHDLENAEVWLELATVREKSGNETSSFAALMEAARCNTLCWMSFARLGDYYWKSSSQPTLDKARRCYQKALQLNPKSDEVGERLSDVLRLLKDVDGNLQLLTVMTKTSGAKWSWLRLGLLYTERGDTELAITSLCNAVRGDPSDSRVWESLGDAYMSRGAWNAALRSYQRVVELNPDVIYPAYQIGTVKLRMGAFEDALIAFRKLVLSSPRYVPALQMQGEAALSLAKERLKEQRLGCARDYCQEAQTALTKVLMERRDLSCTWKLLGDACVFGARLPEAYIHFSLPEWLVSPKGNDMDSESENVTLGKMDMFLLAERLYCRAMPASLENSLLWQDVATTLYWHAVEQINKVQRQELLKRAMAAARRALSVNPRSSPHWNVLAVIAATEEIKEFALAQHALIQALRLDPNSAVAWTNLGTLYFILGQILLANKAFSAAQRSDHDYTNSWLGQAMIAESMDHPETMDLYRHAASLEYHAQSCSGYAHWVLSSCLQPEKRGRANEQDQVLKDMNKMYAVTVATDCMRWYTEHNAKDVCGWNMFGLLLEREGLYRTASFSLKQALTEAINQGLESQIVDSVRCNLGRLLVTSKNYEEAVEVLQKVQQASFASQSGLALALFKAEKFEEAYEAYNTTLEWFAPDDETKAYILISMASMQYCFNQLEACKTLLFQSTELKPVSPYALLALCAIGLLHNDMGLSKLMLRELKDQKDNINFLGHIALLKGYTCFLQGNQLGAVKALSTEVHRHPGEAFLWLSLAQIQMHAYPKCNIKVIGLTAHAALLMGRSNIDISKVQSLVCLAELISEKGRDAALHSQKAVHQFPNVAENWSTLAASLLPLCISTDAPIHSSWLRDLISHIRRRLDPSSSSLKKWLGSYERHLVSLSS